MSKDNHRALKSEPNKRSTADRADGRDTDEQTASEKSDSRGGASLSERTSIARPSSTQLDASQSDNTVLACPECDKSGIKTLVQSGFNVEPSHDHDYRCRFCGATFDTPVERERQNTPGAPGYLAGKLAKADPDDVSADRGEPMTDGGLSVDGIVEDLRDGAQCVITHGETSTTVTWNGERLRADGDTDDALYRVDPDRAATDRWRQAIALALARDHCEVEVLKPVADGSGHDCDACGDSFETLTALRIHEQDDCPQRETFGKLDPDSDDVGAEAAEGLLTCRSCDREFPDIQYDQRTSFADGDFHIIVEFDCPDCGFANENRVVAKNVSRDSLEDLPEHLQPDDEEIATDGGLDAETAAETIAEVSYSAEGALSHRELNALDAVESFLLEDHSDIPVIADEATDDRLEAASKLRCIADDLERSSRQSAADGVEVSVHVSVEETYRHWGGEQ